MARAHTGDTDVRPAEFIIDERRAASRKPSESAAHIAVVRKLSPRRGVCSRDHQLQQQRLLLLLLLRRPAQISAEPSRQPPSLLNQPKILAPIDARAQITRAS